LLCLSLLTLILRYFLHFSFNGAAFSGWQIQPRDPSVQQWISNAVSWTIAETVEVVGCGRTDAGVHASCYYGHFDCVKLIEDKNAFLDKVNKLLNESILVQGVWEVDEKTHARYSAIARTYHYHLLIEKNPFQLPFAWYYRFPLDLPLMNQAAALMLHHNDFKCFCKTNSSAEHYLCKVTKAEWLVENGQLTFVITANRFLRNMVRAVVGTLLEVGRKRMSIDEFSKVLESGSRSDAGMSVPAHGLFLKTILYPEGVVPTKYLCR
jgi:tRNA pseudouridine38-40 synthase